MRLVQPNPRLNDTAFRSIERKCTFDYGFSQIDLEVGNRLHVFEAEELFVEVLKTATNVLVVESCPSMALNCKLAILQGI